MFSSVCAMSENCLVQACHDGGETSCWWSLECDGSGNDCYLMHNIIIHDRNCEDSPAKTCSAVAVLLAGKVATQCLKARGLVSAQKILSLASIVVKSADTSYSCEIP